MKKLKKIIFYFLDRRITLLNAALDQLISDSITAKPIDHEDTKKFKKQLLDKVRKD